MARCSKTWSLDVHHKRRDGGNGLDNAEVLCSKCHEATTTYGNPGPTPPPFSEDTKKKVLARAGNRCECNKSGGCH